MRSGTIHRFCLILLLCISGSVCGQNLVPNNSFELKSACPSVPGSIVLANGWSSASLGTPDYFNSCSSTEGVPLNAVGYQLALSGQAYAGFVAAGSTSSAGALDEREYVQVELNDTLHAGKTYCVEYYLSLADSSELAVDRIGACLSATPVYAATTGVLPFSAQVVSDSGVVISGNYFWFSVSKRYTAIGGEHYLTIGNFNDVFATDTLQVRPQAGNFPFAYYYLEDISVHLCDTIVPLNDEPQFANVFTPNNDGVNDVWTVTKIPADSRIYLFNRWGLLVAEAGQQFALPDVYSWDGNATTGDACSAGIYYYLLETPTKNYHGFVQLLR